MRYQSAVIRQDTLDRIRREADLVALIGESLKLSKRGRSHVGLCPFHKEKSPSFHVNPERGFYHCFGCHESGDAITFLQKVEGLDFVEAVQRIAARLGIPVELTLNEAERQNYANLRRRNDEVYEVLAEAAGFFERMLRENPLAESARQELENRALVAEAPTDPIADALQAFRLGYAPYGWDELARSLRDRSLSLGAAERAGLLAPRKSGPGYYDRFRHRLMFAVLDGQGRVIAFSGRALPTPEPQELARLGLEPKAESADKPPKYYNSSESPVYRKREALFGIYQARAAIRELGSCVLVEGNFDVLSLHARGIKNVVAPLGTAFTLEQAQQIRRYTTELILLFDGDAAGLRAVHASREIIQKAGLTARVAGLPPNLDPDQLIRQSGPSAIHQLLQHSRPILEWLIDGVLDEPFAKDDARTAALRVRSVRGLVEAEQDPAARALAERYADQRLGERLGLSDARTLRAVLAQRGPTETGRSRQTESPERARSPDAREQIPLQVLGAFLDFPELLSGAEIDSAAGLLEGDAAAALGALRQAWDSDRLQNPELLLAKLPPAIHPFARARLAAPRHLKLEEARSELVGNVRQLSGLLLSREKNSVVQELQRTRRTGDSKREDEMLSALVEKVRRTRLNKTLSSE